MKDWIQMMEEQGAFDHNEGDLLGAGISRAELDEMNEHDILKNIERQKSKGVPRENLRLLCGERMVPEPNERYNEETNEYEYRSLIDRDQGITDSWHRFRPMSKATIRKTFWRVM